MPLRRKQIKNGGSAALLAGDPQQQALISYRWPKQGTATYDRVMQDSSLHGEGDLKNAATSVPSTMTTASDMPVEGEQPVLFYDGSPMHDYLASVAPDEAPTMDTRRRLSSSSSVISHQGGGVAADGPASSTAGGEVTSAPAARRKTLSTSSSSSTSSTSRRRRSSPSKRPSHSSPSKRTTSARHHSNSSSSTHHNTTMMDISNDPLFNEAKERLNLLLVSYLSAPHYSALPPQDQECIDRETVNAFLLDERFQRYGRQRGYSSPTSGRSAGNGSYAPEGGRAALQRREGSSKQQEHQPRLMMTRPAQLFFLGLCSLALLTPAFTASSSASTAASSEITHSAINDLMHAFLPESMMVSSWPSWTGTLIRSAPGVVALTSLTAFFARSSLRTVTPTSSASLNTSITKEAETEEVIRELRKLFNACKKFIDECTRLDITLEKGFTVLLELDRLAGLEGEESLNEDEAEEDEACHRNNNGIDSGSWQDLTTIEARLSSSYPHQYAPSPARQTRTRQKKQRLPALPVRQAIFASLYTVQDKLEKELDALARSFETEATAFGRTQESGQDDIDTLELVRLLDMYNCHPPSYTAQPTSHPAGAASLEDEEAAERLYRRTMARRSLSPTLYNEKQQNAQTNHAAAKLKRRSGMYIPAPPSSVREEPVSSIQQTFGITSEEQIGRRASWAAFQPSHRRQAPSHPSASAQQQAQKGTSAAVPPSPTTATSSGLQGLARNQAMATPPRVRPQSIHFGGVISSTSNNMAAVTSSPLANGARESNSTIKRERRRRSEQLFSLATLQSQSLHPNEDEALSLLRSSTSSAASTSSSIGSSANLRLSISSQGTSADPVTAASNHIDLYDSPSRPTHARRTSLGPAAGSGALQRQQNRRSRPLSMHELDFGRSLHRASLSHLNTDRRTSLDEVPEADSTASHRNAAAAALERRWSAHPSAPFSASMSASTSTASLPSRPRDRPTSLLLESSPVLSSSPIRRARDMVESPAASFRSRKNQQHSQQMLAPQRAKSKFAVSSLRESSEHISTLERALVCHLLALKYSSVSGQRLRRVLALLISLVEGVNACINSETASLTKTMWEEFEDGPAKTSSEEAGTTAPPASVLLATPMTSSSPFQSTPKRGSFIALLPGSYPSSPIIEVDPATPPLETAKHTPQGSFFCRFDQDEVSEQVQDFAPREPFSSTEQSGRKALSDSHVELNAALRSIATKVYMERQDLKEYFDATKGGPTEIAAQQYTLQQMELRQESLRTDLQSLLRAWEEGRASLRQIKEGRQRRIHGAQATRRVEGQEASSDVSEYDNAEEEPSLMSASAELEKHGSISSVLSSGNEDSLSTPALSPFSPATYQPLHVSELLLDSTDPSQLPRYGMQEQLFETYVGGEEDQQKKGKGNGKFSREERIALAKAKRLENKENLKSVSVPQANAELISELKDMVALLRSRNAAVLADQQ